MDPLVDEGNVWPHQEELKALLDELAAKPGSKLQIDAISVLAMKHSKEYYKYIVYDINKFVKAVGTKSKIAGVYVIDAILKRGKTKYGDKSVYQKRFAKTIVDSLKICFKENSDEDKSKMRRVITIWLEEKFFPQEVSQAIKAKFLKNGEKDVRKRNSHQGIKTSDKKTDKKTESRSSSSHHSIRTTPKPSSTTSCRDRAGQAEGSRDQDHPTDRTQSADDGPTSVVEEYDPIGQWDDVDSVHVSVSTVQATTEALVQNKRSLARVDETELEAQNSNKRPKTDSPSYPWSYPQARLDG